MKNKTHTMVLQGDFVGLESSCFGVIIFKFIHTNGHLKNIDNLYAYLYSLLSIRITGNCDA